MGTAKFHEIAGQRSAAALKKMQLLGNLRRSEYKATTEDLQQLVDPLQNGVDDLRHTLKLTPKLTPSAESTQGRFRDDYVRGDSRSVGTLTGRFEHPPEVQELRRVPVSGGDRADIRAALKKMHHGDIKGGFSDLTTVVLGWPVPDNEDN